MLRYLYFPPRNVSGLLSCGFACTIPSTLEPALPAAGSRYPSASPLLSSRHRRYTNFYVLSITYAFRPRLRSRLTLGGRALPRKPRIFDGKDSHFTFATHSGILTAVSSTPPYGGASAYCGTLPYHTYQRYVSIASVYGFRPVNLRRRPTRLVSYYALFE